MQTVTILAGDIGGTKAAFALFHATAGRLALIRTTTYPSSSGAGLAELIRRFTVHRHTSLFDVAAFGFAGPVMDGRARAVNLPWPADQQRLRQELANDRIFLLNDLAALAHAVAYLQAGQYTTLQEAPAAAGGNIGIIAAGTGLGQAMLVRSDGGREVVCHSEGGHRDFACRNDTEFQLQDFLSRQYGHVSVERVLSGMGIIDLYRFFLKKHRRPEPAWLAPCLAAKDAAPIAHLALTGEDDLCRAALLQFVSVYGAEAGNLALQCLATGGIYLGGGIAPKILPLLREPLFLEAFTRKGRMRDFLQTIPVKCITDSTTALWGAARYALRQMEG